MTQLKPCPFCESKDVTVIIDGGKYKYVHCDKCGADGPPDLGESGAVEQWNTRPEVDALQAESAELKAQRDAVLALSETIENAIKIIPSPEEVALMRAENARLRAIITRGKTIVDKIVDAAWDNEIIATGMEHTLIGPGKKYFDRDDWCEWWFSQFEPEADNA